MVCPACSKLEEENEALKAMVAELQDQLHVIQEAVGLVMTTSPDELQALENSVAKNFQARQWVEQENKVLAPEDAAALQELMADLPAVAEAEAEATAVQAPAAEAPGAKENAQPTSYAAAAKLNKSGRRKAAEAKKQAPAATSPAAVATSVPAPAAAAAAPAAPQAAAAAAPAAKPSKLAQAAEAKLAARVAAEQKRLREEAKEKKNRAGKDEDSDEEADRLERERVLLEDAAREQRKAEERAADAAAAREREAQRRRRAEEKRQAEEEERHRLEREKKALPQADFEALQAMRAEAAQPEAEMSPNELDDGSEDEEAILEREMRKTEREARALKEQETKPKSIEEMLMQMNGMPAFNKELMAKTLQTKQRNMLKEKLHTKLQSKRDLEAILGTGRAKR